MSSTSAPEPSANDDSSSSAPPDDPAEPFSIALPEPVLNTIFEALRTHAHTDFSGYKRGTVRRRIERRMQVLQLHTGDAYATYVQAHPEEVEALFRALLIQVTQFFREPPTFQVLVETAIRPLLQRLSSNDTVRVWVPGCATGEEAYTLAMLFAEEAQALDITPAFQLFATDMDAEAIAVARRGRYPTAIEEDVSPERLARFFTRVRDGYRIRSFLREQMVFAPQNVVEDPPFSRLHLISCRNVLIYLDTPLQQRVLHAFHYALKPNGFLFLGSSESIGDAEPLFVPHHKTVRLFQRRLTDRSPALSYPLIPYTEQTPSAPPHPHSSLAVPVEYNYRDTLHKRLLEEYAPPSLLVNESGTILQLSGATQPFLHFPEGELSTNVLELVREDLRLELRLALHHATQHQHVTRLEGLQLASGTDQQVDIVVEPLGQPNRVMLFRISFEDRTEKADPVSPQTVDAPADARDLIQKLERELAETKQRLHDAIEDKERSQADLYATIEELRSMNEELQSTTEELQTSKEELQSLNEELQTVNEQLHHNIEELTHTNDDLQNLIASTDIATIFLDRDFQIMRYTERATDLFRLIESDLGRPLSDVSASLVDLDVVSIGEQVFTTLKAETREVYTPEATYLMRVLPYRTQDNHITGVVFTFIDITSRKQIEDALQMSKERYRLIVETQTDAVCRFDLDFKLTYVNPAYCTYFGKSEDELLGVSFLDLVPDASHEGLHEHMARLRKHKRSIVYEHEVIAGDGTLRWQQWVDQPILDEAGNLLEFQSVGRDITERKLFEKELIVAKEEAEAMNRLKTAFLANMSHEIRTPLTSVIGFADLLRHTLPDESRDLAKFIVRGGTRLLETLNAMLDLARLESGEMQLREEQVDVVAELREAVDLLKPVAQERNLRLAFETDTPELHAVLDRQSLHRVATNLLINAIKFTQEGDIILALDSDKKRIIFSVEDAGLGIDPRFLPRVFEAFQQESTGISRSHEGIGLGLTICKRLVDLMEGHITVASEKHQGSTFTVTLPLYPPNH